MDRELSKTVEIIRKDIINHRKETKPVRNLLFNKDKRSELPKYMANGVTYLYTLGQFLPRIERGEGIVNLINEKPAYSNVQFMLRSMLGFFYPKDGYKHPAVVDFATFQGDKGLVHTVAYREISMEHFEIFKLPEVDKSKKFMVLDLTFPFNQFTLKWKKDNKDNIVPEFSSRFLEDTGNNFSDAVNYISQLRLYSSPYTNRDSI